MSAATLTRIDLTKQAIALALKVFKHSETPTLQSILQDSLTCIQDLESNVAALVMLAFLTAQSRDAPKDRDHET